MPLKPTVKLTTALYQRRPAPLLARAGLWVSIVAGVCVVTWACLGVEAAPQNFPEASEDNHFIFRTDGTYSFSYDTGSGEHQSFRTEARDSEGRVSGRFGYVDPDGALRITEYQADTKGYRANMEIYHLVSWSPRSPLLVGPLPQHPTQLQDLPKLKDTPQQTSSGSVGPSLFFPPQRPVLIIGPLPKPLQPPRNQLDQKAPDLSEDSLLGVSPGNLLALPPVGFLQGPVRQDPSQTPSPEVLQEGILNSIIQSTVQDVLQESATPVLNSADLNDAVKQSNYTLQDTDLQSPKFTLEDDYLDMLQDPEQIVGQIAVAGTVEQPEESTSTPLMATISSTNNSSPTLTDDNVNNSIVSSLQEIVFNTAANASLQVLIENSSKNITGKTQNNSQTTFSTANNETTTHTPSTTVTTNTTIISQNRVTSTSPPVSWSGLGIPRQSDAAQSATIFIDKLPPVPALTYLPVGDDTYDKPRDVFAQLPQTFSPFV